MYQLARSCAVCVTEECFLKEIRGAATRRPSKGQSQLQGPWGQRTEGNTGAVYGDLGAGGLEDSVHWGPEGGNQAGSDTRHHQGLYGVGDSGPGTTASGRQMRQVWSRSRTSRQVRGEAGRQDHKPFLQGRM